MMSWNPLQNHLEMFGKNLKYILLVLIYLLEIKIHVKYIIKKNLLKKVGYLIIFFYMKIIVFHFKISE